MDIMLINTSNVNEVFSYLLGKMALWNKVLAGFDKDEETVNFGTRTVAENNGSLYETFTIATIRSDGEVKQQPNVMASVQYSRICVAIDKSITIFENETCEKMLLNASFGLSIVSYCISDNRSYLFLVLSNGVLFCLYLLSGQVIFKKNITKNGDPIVTIFSQHKCDEYIVYLIAKSGAIFRVSKFKYKQFEAAISNEDNITVQELADQVQCIQLFKGFNGNEVIYATIGIVCEEITVAILCSNMLFMWPSEQYFNFNDESYNYTKVKFFKNNVAMLCLCMDNTLNMVCPRTLLGLKIYQESVLDFTIIEDMDNSLSQILILTANNDDPNMCKLRVMSFPDFEEIFQIDVPITVYLVEIMDPRDEIILFLDGIKDFQNNTNFIDTIRIKTVSESLPECQLQRLIRKEQFGKAEEFAKKFNLSTEPIYFAKASLLVSQFGPWAKKSSNLHHIEELLNLFEKIESVQHIVECCSKALVPQYKQMRKIYLYARTRIMENIAKIPSEDNLNHLDLVNSTLHKLETFHLIWGCRQNLDYYDDETMKKWIRFSQANCMGELMSYLNLGEMEAATLIWSRHLPDIRKYLSVELVKFVFSTLAEEISPSILWPWLSHFIPTLLSVIPSAICEIITWGCKKVKSFEQSHRDSWPQIGIDFSYKLIKLLKFEENHQFVGIHNECLSKNSNLKQLVTLIQAMSDIKKLKYNYRLTISLDAYMGNPIEVSYILLDKIYIDIIPNFVDNFLKQYMLNNSLQNDYIFSSYVQKVMKSCKSWWSGEEAPWAKRVVMIINLIQDVKTRLQQTLEVLKKASVPWSSTIVNLAEISTNLDHALASQVKIELSCVPIKLILKKYGYERIGINSKLICRIIRENHENMISDIQQITKNDPLLQKKAFSSCINYYLSKGNILKVTEIFNYVETLETSVLLFCCVQIVNYVSASLTLKTTPKYIEHYIEMFGWIKLQLEEISNSGKTQSHYCHSIITSMTEVKSLYLLKTEFQIHVTIKEYMLEKKKILENYIEKLCNEDTQTNDNFITVYRQIIKVAKLLKLEQLDAVSMLLEKTKNIGIFKYFARSIGGHSTLIPDECPYIYKICLTILKYGDMDDDAAIAIKNLISFTICVCPDNELQSALSLAIWVNLYQECFNKGNKYGLKLLDAQQEETLKTNWKLYTVYQDLAIAADGFMLPLFRDMIFMQQFHPVKQTSCAENSYEELLKNLLNKMRKLRAEHNDYCFLQIVKTLYFNSCIMANINSVVVTEIKTIYCHFLIMLLKKVISSRTFDIYLGLSCLFMLSEVDTYKWIPSACKAYQSDCTRHLRISVLAYEYYRLCKNKSFLQIYKDNKILHSWALKLSKYSISYKEFLTSDATARREILQRIMHYNGNDMISLYQDFCTDFDFDVQDCLLIYLQIIIKSWDPKLNVSNVNGKEELHIDEDDVNDLKKKCKIVAAKILNEDFLKNSVTTVLSEVNFYYYEVFIILMDLIKDKNIGHRNYFCFLQNYTRNSQPTQVERDEWMHLNLGHTSLPPIAKWRLPFLPKIELWTSITPELNLKTYEKWLDIAPVLKLQPHIICSLAIKGEVTRTWGNIHKTEEWSLCAKNSSLLNDIKKCIGRMTGPNALYYGTAALYYVVNHTPPGADRVAAVEECYKYGLLSVQQSTKFEEGMLEKIKFKYFHFTSEHILRTHGLGIPKYLSLIGHPHKLVRELYTDETIPQRYRCITDHRPDINAAVHAINELFPINLVKLRMDLLQEWLQPEVKYMKFNQSITDTFSIITNSESKSNSDDNLLRACYILEHGDIELSANFLINIGFSENYEDYTPETCYKALHVLQLLVDTEQLEDLTKRDIQTIRKHMCSLKYIYRLESLGIMYNINTFTTSSKEELVRVLMKTQSHSSQALVLIAQICIDFKIYEYTLWDKNLTALAKLLMINELKWILLQVRNVSAIVNCNGYLLGWQAVILEPFRKMDSNPSEEQTDNCLEALQLLYSCPVVHVLHFRDIITYCFQCQQPHLAAAILPFLNDDDKEYVLQEIKNTSRVKELLEDLNKLLLNGILCVSYCYKVIENALLETKP